jgi:hypothetical protein
MAPALGLRPGGRGAFVALYEASTLFEAMWHLWARCAGAHTAIYLIEALNKSPGARVADSVP